MKIILNDGQEMTVQSAGTQADGTLLIRTISATEDDLKRIFADTFATKKITVKEREDILGVYENYTKFDAVVLYTAGILGVILYKEGETPQEKMVSLQQENKELKSAVEILQGCILEMSELVYQ